MEEKKKCGSSKKRIGLLGYKCRCARIICVKHQYSEEHGLGILLEAMTGALIGQETESGFVRGAAVGAPN
ncbi:NEP1-interacting protein-like 1 [Linum perenne]